MIDFPMPPLLHPAAIVAPVAAQAAPTTLPVNVPTTPAAQGLVYAVCLGLLLPAAGFFPLWCAAALRGKGLGLKVLAGAAGVVAITAALILQRPIPGVLQVVGMYFVLAAGVMLAVARFRATRARRSASPNSE